MKLSPEFAQIAFWIALATCVVAQVGMLRSTLRGMASRDKAPATDASTAAAAARVRKAPELLWALVPAIALVFVFLGSWQAMHRVAQSNYDHEAPQPPPPATIPEPAARFAAEVRREPPQRAERRMSRVGSGETHKEAAPVEMVETEIPLR